MSGIVNKIKEAVHSDKKHEQPSGTSGPHDSRAANVTDPRVDSDRDHRANPASSMGGDNYRQSGPGMTTGGTNTLGSSGTTSTSTNHGPHDSNIANKVDPRVDSDRDGRAARTGGMASTTEGYGSSNLGTSGGEFGSSRTTGASDFGSSRTTGAGEFGSSNIGNTTRSGAEYGSATTGGLGSTATTSTSTNRGPHDSNVANKLDPRFDSDRDHRAAPGSTTTGAMSSSGVTGTTGGRTTGTTGTTGTSGLMGSTGPAPSTAGPHKSDMMNKVDPRVDSDRDGSKTLGTDQTYSRSSNAAYKDPTDAAQVPPSVLAKHLGEPSVEHGDHGHDRARRNSSTTHQEAHRGL